MKRIRRVLAGALIVGACTAANAVAASSPTVITGGAQSITGSTAVLHGRVNPNGSGTDYSFEYGTTTSYGTATTSLSAGDGIRGVDVARGIAGLTPGTVYHYRIDALNRSGSASGADRTFKTAGPPPPGAVTGPAVDVRKTVATPTGSVNPNGALTTWSIQYGLTTSYGFSTFPQTLSAVTSPLGVSTQLVGLAPATLFHYRIVADHGPTSAGVGLDSTFFTEPDRRPQATMTTKTTPGAAKRSPYAFTTAGTVRGGSYIPAAQRCTGSVGIRYYNGKRQLAYVVAALGSDCKFTGQVSFKRTYGKGAVPVKVTIYYRGNGYLTPVNRTDHVTAGR